MAKKKKLTEAERDREWKKVGVKYVNNIPRKITKGRVLVHNHVIPQKAISHSGFRAWTQKLSGGLLEVCTCDWAGVDLHGLRHYRVKA
jgi:hypothetical protein